MSIRHTLGKVRWAAISAMSRRKFRLTNDKPIVSFTFDDFPKSALHVGGEILKDHGVRGTYYASMGLMGTVNHLGEHFDEGDLEHLLADGHQLGSHTYSHLSGRTTGLAELEADAVRGRQAVEQITGASGSHHFSYPYGHATLRAKPRIGRLMSSCRSTTPGINKSPVDMNFLRANSLYSHSFDIDRVKRLIEENEKCCGWLIFYTHDVRKDPSQFGCTPSELQRVLGLAVDTSDCILPVTVDVPE